MKLRMLKVARLGFEPRSAGPKPTMMDHYTIGLQSVGRCSCFCPCRLVGLIQAGMRILYHRFLNVRTLDKFVKVKLLLLVVHCLQSHVQFIHSFDKLSFFADSLFVFIEQINPLWCYLEHTCSFEFMFLLSFDIVMRGKIADDNFSNIVHEAH